MSSNITQDKHVKLFVRVNPSLGAEQQKQEVIDRLRTLEQKGKIGNVDVHVWRREIRIDGPLKETEYHKSVMNHVDEFERWLAENNTSMDDFFSHRDIDSSISNERYSVISLPFICLAVYQDDELRDFYPHRDSATPHTVHDGLDRLEIEDSRKGTQ
ncbi:hypothetical protein BG842_09405 [Haladaptatus sp. W1]|uniref:HTH domain-containing protein n=1 Tax=Haladaptatus sp. W1 TaxID=1897478 RepID=UPI0008498607|nr:HTH domain-containing protein [Haladaptatus sp. W1]ODR82920.1 hypothetical protein BG842_09405 [Haladaptatus sp. W1]